MKDTSFILLAAGRGERIGFPKIQLKIAGNSIILFHLSRIKEIEFIGEVVIAVPLNYEKKIIKLLKKVEEYPFDIKVVKGGKTRTESVYNALRISSFENIIIHDIARVYFPLSLFKKVHDNIIENKIVVPYITPRDMVVYKDRILERDKIKLIHTPQGVKRELLLKAYKLKGRKNFPDESSLLKETLGIKPEFIKSSPLNIKITYNEDLELIKFMEKKNFYIGFGFDIHRVKNKRGVIFIGGVEFKSMYVPIAHSDGDVVLHAVTDAILGASSLGDIGEHFPDTDRKWKGVRSEIFVKQALKMAKKRGFSLSNIDVIVYSELFKLGERKREIEKNLSSILGLPVSRVNVKAKSYEGLSDIGKKKAIASEAICLMIKNES